MQRYRRTIRQVSVRLSVCVVNVPLSRGSCVSSFVAQVPLGQTCTLPRIKSVGCGLAHQVEVCWQQISAVLCTGGTAIGRNPLQCLSR